MPRSRERRGELLCELPDVRGGIGRINSPDVQLAESVNFSKTWRIVSAARRTNARRVGTRTESERDNVIKVTTLMGALLKPVYYASAITAGNALYRANILEFPGDTREISDR